MADAMNTTGMSTATALGLSTVGQPTYPIKPSAPAPAPQAVAPAAAPVAPAAAPVAPAPTQKLPGAPASAKPVSAPPEDPYEKQLNELFKKEQDNLAEVKTNAQQIPLLEQQQKIDEAEIRRKEQAAINEIKDPIYHEQNRIIEEQRNADKPFIPTKESVGEIALMFTLIGMIGSALGSTKSTQSALAAQNAMTGMLQGWQKGMADDYKQQKDIYDENVNYLQRSLALSQKALDNYTQNVIAGKISEAQSQYQIELAAAGNATAAARAKQAGALASGELIKSQQSFAEKMAALQEKKRENLEREADRRMALEDRRQMYLDRKGPTLTEGALEFAATQSLFTGVTPAGLARQGAGAFNAFYNKKFEIATRLGIDSGIAGAMAAGYASNKTALSALTKVETAIDAQERTMLDNIKVAQKAAPGALPSAIPFLNRWYQSGSKALGSEGAPEYAAAIITVADEYAKIISGSTGAAGSTDAARKQAVDIITPYLNSGQIDKVYEVLRQDAENKRRDYRAVRESLLTDIERPSIPGYQGAPGAPGGQTAPTVSNW